MYGKNVEDKHNNWRLHCILCALYGDLFLLVCVADICQSQQFVSHVRNKFNALRIKWRGQGNNTARTVKLKPLTSEVSAIPTEPMDGSRLFRQRGPENAF